MEIFDLSLLIVLFLNAIVFFFKDTMLPCEFCEELFPEDDLILHQVCAVIQVFLVQCL